MKWIVGIDEAGRGPLAGPVAVGVVVVPENFNWEGKLPGVADSKKISEKKREAVFLAAEELKQAGEINFQVAFMSARNIDAIGIVLCIRQAIAGCLDKLELETGEIDIKLDGGLNAPAEFENQETIIKGDEKEPTIGLASICAKVMRDRYMKKLAEQAEFASYDLATHKGYGTKKHREAIAEHGLSSEHRASFCRNIKIAK